MLDTITHLPSCVAFLDTSGFGGASGPDWGRYLLVCTGLISLILLGGMGAKRLLRQSAVARAGRRSIQIHDVLPLGGRQKLAVVRCYDRTFVLGLGDREVTLVGELDENTDLARTRETQVEAAPARQSTAAALVQAMGGDRASGSARKAQFADLLRRLGEGGSVQSPIPASAPQATPSQAAAAAPEAVRVATSVEEPASLAAARPQTVAEALRGEGVLG